MTLHRNTSPPSSPKKVFKTNVKYHYYMNSPQLCIVQSRPTCAELQIMPTDAFSKSCLPRSYCRRRPHHRRQNAIIVGNNELSNNISPAEFSKDRKSATLVTDGSSTKGPIDHLNGARSSSILIKLEAERSSSPTSTMMEIETNLDDENDEPEQITQVRQPKVRFVESVKVTEIPNRKEYTSEQRYRMWNNSAAIRHMAYRNTVEYNWESRDWRQAVEEESFFHYHGSLVHPAHYQAACDHHREQMVSASTQVCLESKH